MNKRRQSYFRSSLDLRDKGPSQNIEEALEGLQSTVCFNRAKVRFLDFRHHKGSKGNLIGLIADHIAPGHRVSSPAA